MPTYEYQCFSCGHHFETSQKISDEPLRDCPACGKADLKRLLSAAAFHLKGSGWYKTDYASSSSNGGKHTTNGDAKTGSDGESTAEAKVETPKEAGTTASSETASD